MDRQNSTGAQIFRSIPNDFGLKNLVNETTRNLDHTFDLAIVCVENSKVGSVNIEPQKTISDQVVITSKKHIVVL